MTTYTLFKTKQIRLRKYLFGFLAVLFTTHAFAQTAPSIQWQKSFGGSGHDYANSIQQTIDGGYIVAGYSQSIDGDVSGNHGDRDYWVAKLNDVGHVQWQKSLGGSRPDEATSIQQTVDGGYIVAGYSWSNDGDVSGHNGNISYCDFWIVKLNSAGNIEWQKSLGGNSSDVANSIQQTTDGGYIVAGYSDSNDGDISGHHGFLVDYWVVKLNSTGNIQWEKSLGGTDNEYANSIQQTGDGGYIVAGNSSSNDGDVSGHHGSISYSDDLWVVKLNSAGSIEWQKSVGGINSDRGNSIQQTADGGYIVGGSSTSNDGDVSGHHGSISYSDDLWVVKLNSAGSIEWQKSLGGTDDEYANSIQQTGDGGYIVAGNSSSNNGDVSGNNGSPDYWIVKLNNIGNIQWQKCLGGSNYEEVNSIQQTVDAGYIVAGCSYSNDGDVSGNHGIDDYWIVKLNSDGLFSTPKIYTSSGSLNIGQTETITGSGFTNNGSINLYVKNSVGDSIPTNNNSFSYLPNGGFTYQLPITSGMPGGEYEVYATDVTTGVTTSTIKFLVNNSVPSNLVINKPALNDQYVLNQTVPIQWGDFISKSLVTGKTGYVQKTYKIELSKDNGNTWVVLESNHVIKNAVPGIFNTGFSSSCTITTTGTYLIRITDNDNPSDYSTSNSFKVVTSGSGGFDYSLEWDQSSPTPGMAHPIGLAADGTSRIFVKLLRSSGNIKSVTKIKATISSITDSYTTPDLLGKIMYAQNHTTYNEDGNNATLTSYTYPVTQNGNEFWFWLVAPDDFTRDPTDEKNERQIQVSFTITYSDNSTEVITTKKAPIYIVRPPLFLVHGINDDASCFVNLKYNVGSGYKFFNNDAYRNPAWIDSKRLTLFSYGSYAQNAEVILGTSTGDKNENTFQYHLKFMHDAGYSCNRVDYVTHSMGGCVARTMINLYVESYSPPVSKANLYAYKNYSKGFINKLITVNTPHNGSEIADLLSDKYKNGLDRSILNTIRSFGQFDGFFEPDGDSYKISSAISDLQGSHGGITFSNTIIKNHLIGSDVDFQNQLSQPSLFSYFDNKKYTLLYSFLLPSTNVHDYMTNHYPTKDLSNTQYLNNSDLMVPISSQLATKIETDADVADISEGQNLLKATTASVIHNETENHTEVTQDPIVGTRIMYLLNAPINSSYFASSIAANLNLGGSHTYKIKEKKSVPDSIKNYYDTLKIKIANPNRDSIVYVDSTISIQLSIKDTSSLKGIQLLFQGELYSSNLKLSLQSFNVKVNPNQIGKDKILAEAIYDSLGFTISYVDTVTINVKTFDTLKGFYITPKSVNLNSKQTFIPEYNAIFSHYIGVINSDNSSLQFKIGDKHVIKYVDSLHEFIAKDTGSTYIICKYKGFADTGYIYITNTSGSSIAKALPSVKTTTDKLIAANENESLKIYPNPTKGKFTIELGNKGNIKTIKVTDENGKIIYNHSSLIKTTILEIDLSKYASGVYYIEASDGVKKYDKKVIIGR